MRRPRWHDLLIVAAIAGLLVVGAWALWWDDVRGLFFRTEPASATPSGQT